MQEHSAENPIRLLIADDHQLFISGVRELLSKNPEVEVVDEAKDGQELLKLVKLRTVDLVVMDVSMPVMDGKEACIILKKDHPELKVLMLTMHDDPKTIGELLDAGADGYLLKEASKRELLLAIKTVVETGRYFSRQVADEYMAHVHRQKSGETSKGISLTSREREILKLIVAEHTAQEIADKLFLSINTIITHRKNLIQKFNVRNTAGLVREAVKMGLD